MPGSLPVEFLFDASTRSLQDALLAAEDESARYRKTHKVEVEAWIRAEAKAELIRWFLDHRAKVLAHREIEVHSKKAELAVEPPHRKTA